MAWMPTTEQILDTSVVRRRADSFRFQLLDRDEGPIGELGPDMAQPPVVSNDATATIPRTLTSLNLPAGVVDDINPVSDRVRVWMRLQNGDEFSLGIFLWGSDDEPERPWGVELASSMVDKMHILEQGIVTPLGWPEGASTALITIFILIHGGDPVFQSMPSATTLDEVVNGLGPMNATLGSSVAYPPGTARSQILREMHQFNGLLPPYYDRDGRLRSIEPPEIGESVPDLIYAEGRGIVANSIVRSNDLLTAPNWVTRYETSGTRTVRGHHRFSASARHSIENRGYRVADVESKQGLKTNQQATKQARTDARSGLKVFEYRSFQSTADARHDTWDVLSLKGENWLEPQWAITCRSGTPMEHVVRRDLF